eukprot:218866_1
MIKQVFQNLLDAFTPKDTNTLVCQLTKIHPNHMISCKIISNITTGKFGSTYIVSGDNKLIVFGDNRYNQLFLLSHITWNKNTLLVVINYWNRTNSDTALPIDVLSSITSFCTKWRTDYTSITAKESICIDRYPKIKLISNGVASCHKFIMTETNALYGFGLNECQQIREDNSNYNVLHTSSEYVSINYFNNRNINIIQIACARTYSTFLSSNGKVYVFGDCNLDLFGCLHIYEIKIQLVESLKNIVQICNGDDHTLALDDNGDVFSFGCNNWGQLGHYNSLHGSATPNMIDYLIAFDTKIISIQCGCEHSLILNENGKIHCFGRNLEHQCSDMESMNAINSKNKFISIRCGYNHNCAETDKHEWFLWGWNNNNQCLVNNNKSCIEKPTKFIGKGIGKIIDIYPGYCETRVITSSGQSNSYLQRFHNVLTTSISNDFRLQ